MASYERQPGSWDGLVVLCAGNAWDSVKVADQHLAMHLSCYAPILYVDPPMSRVTALRDPERRAGLEGPRLRLVESNIARLTLVGPPAAGRLGVRPLATRLARREIRRATGALGGRVHAQVTMWTLAPTFGAARERLKVYWAQDDFVGGARLLGMSPRAVARGEARLARDADLVIAANPGVATAMERYGRTALLIPFGCDAEMFARVDEYPPPTDVSLPRPIVGQVGQINERTDLRILEAIAEAGHSLLLVGPCDRRTFGHQFDVLVSRSNVQHVGVKAFEELPRYLGVMDVGIVPYTDSSFNRGSFPLKMLEYLAAGLPVVSTDLPAARWLDTDLIAIASSPRLFADAVSQALALPRTADQVARRRAFASRNGWAVRGHEFAEAIGIAALH